MLIKNFTLFNNGIENNRIDGIGRLSDPDGNSKCVVVESNSIKSFCNDKEKAKEVVINQKIPESFQQNKKDSLWDLMSWYKH